MNNNTFGVLYVVATPIGNLEDITIRAQNILASVNWVCVEDTRHSRALFTRLGIAPKLIKYHDHNETAAAEKILASLQQGQSVALISDAGTPLISDPGYRLVLQAQQLHIRVVPIPGPSALTCAISVAGLPTDRFIFEGFLPAKSQARLMRIKQLAHEERTMIFYESPHRILACLTDMQSIWGRSRRLCIAREMTKLFETIYQDTIEEVIALIQADENQRKGEFVVVVAGAPAPPSATELQLSEVLQVLMQQLPVKQAAELAANITGCRRNEAYSTALRIKASSAQDED